MGIEVRLKSSHLVTFFLGQKNLTDDVLASVLALQQGLEVIVITLATLKDSLS